MTRTPRQRCFKTNIRSLMRQKAARDDMPITQAVVSEATGVSRATLSRWINGKIREIDADTAFKLAEYFECDLVELVEFQFENDREA